MKLQDDNGTALDSSSTDNPDIASRAVTAPVKPTAPQVPTAPAVSPLAPFVGGDASAGQTGAPSVQPLGGTGGATGGPVGAAPVDPLAFAPQNQPLTAAPGNTAAPSPTGAQISPNVGPYSSVYQASNPYQAGDVNYDKWNNDPYAPGSSESAWYTNNFGTADQLSMLQRLVPDGQGGYSDPQNPTAQHFSQSMKDALTASDTYHSQPYSEDVWNGQNAATSKAFSDAGFAVDANGTPIPKDMSAQQFASIGNYNPAGTVNSGSAFLSGNYGINGAPPKSNPDAGPSSYLTGGLQVDGSGNAVQGGYNALTDATNQRAAAGLTPGSFSPAMIAMAQQNPALLQSANLSGTGSLTGTTGNSTPSTTTGGAQLSPAAIGTSNAPTATNTAGSLAPQPVGNYLPSGTPAGAPNSAASSSPGANYANVTPTDPNNDLRSQTITPGPGLDRYAQAQDQLKTFNDATAPYYTAALRQATQSAAGAGQLGSGMLRTSLGDLANQRNLQLETQGQTFLQNALSGSVSDSQANLAALLAEQQYQTGAQNQAFNQNVTGQQLQDQLTNSAFGRSLSQLTAGNSNNPADAQLLLSQIFGTQATSAGQSLAQMLAGSTANQSNSSQLAQLIAMLQGKTAGASTGTTGASAVNGGSGVTPSTLQQYIQQNPTSGEPDDWQDDYNNYGWVL